MNSSKLTSVPSTDMTVSPFFEPQPVRQPNASTSASNIAANFFIITLRSI